MPNQLFGAGIQARDIYPELKIYFYKEHSNVTWEEFITTKFRLWIDTRSSTTLFMVAAEQWKKVTYCFRSKRYLRLVKVILHATCLDLKMQWLI